jgi:hypothetical protein
MVVRVGISSVMGGVLLAACLSKSSESPGSGPSNVDGGVSGGGDSDGGRSAEGGTGEDSASPDGTLLYQRHKRSGNDAHDSIIARDLASGHNASSPT